MTDALFFPSLLYCDLFPLWSTQSDYYIKCTSPTFLLCCIMGVPLHVKLDNTGLGPNMWLVSGIQYVVSSHSQPASGISQKKCSSSLPQWSQPTMEVEKYQKEMVWNGLKRTVIDLDFWRYECTQLKCSIHINTWTVFICKQTALCFCIMYCVFTLHLYVLIAVCSIVGLSCEYYSHF